MTGTNSVQRNTKSDSHEVQCLFNLAEQYGAQGQYDQAREILLSVLERELTGEETRSAFLRLAELSRELDDYQRALDYWNSAALSYVEALDASAYALHGDILLYKYRSAEIDARDPAVLARAVQSYEHAVRLEPERDTLAWSYLGLAMASSDQELMGRATEYLNKVLDLAPENEQLIADSYVQLGMIEAWHHYRPEKALPLFQLALDTTPLEAPSNWLSHLYWHISHALVQAGRPEEAIPTAEKALEVMDFDDVDYSNELLLAHTVLGWAHYSIPGQEDQAIEHYLQALELEEESATYLYLGRLYFAKEQFGQALEMFKAAMDAEPDYEHPGDIHNAIGACLGVLEQHQEALTYLQKAREEQATVTFKPYQIYKNLGWSYWHLGRYDEATEAFKTALGLMHPKDREYRKIEHYLRSVQARASAPMRQNSSG